MRYSRSETSTWLSEPATAMTAVHGRKGKLTSKVSSGPAFWMPPLGDPGVVAEAIREWFDSFDDGISAWRLPSQEA